jgi:hypothetical protein
LRRIRFGIGFPPRLASVADELDEIFLRALKLRLEDITDENDAELAKLIPALVKAGYAEESGHSSTGFFWAWTDKGIKRAEELGWWDAPLGGEH